MFSNEKVEAFDDATPEIDLEDNPRVKALAKKVRSSVDENGKPVSKMRMYQFRDGLFEAMLHRSRPTRRWLHGARKTATGAAPSPSTAA